MKRHISLCFPAEPHIHLYTMYLQGSFHAVSSFRVLTNGRLTAVCPQNKKIPPETQFHPRAVQSRVCCELNSTLADFKRICSRKLSYFPSLKSQQIVPHYIAMISNALNINPKYFNIKCNGSFRINCSAPTLKGDLKFLKWGPNGDPILSEMGTKWRPSTAEMGTQKAYISKLTETS